MHETAQP